MNVPLIYIASSSAIRHTLLRAAGIPFTVIEQDADERIIDWHKPLDEVVAAVAQHKMTHVKIPSSIAKEGEIIYVVTADTLAQDRHGNNLGKPASREEARTYIKNAFDVPQYISTGICVEKKQYTGGVWITRKQIVKVVTGSCTVSVPEEDIEYYLDMTGALGSCGALVIDDIGSQYTKEIKGSYTGIIGLPIYELVRALRDLAE